MKKIITLLLMVCLSSLSFAQPDSIKSNKISRKIKWVCSFAFNNVQSQIGEPEKASWGFERLYPSDKKEESFSFSIIPKYLIRNDFLLRIEIGFTNLNFTYIKNYKDGNHTIANQTVHQNIFRFIPGLQWNFLSKRKLEFFLGSYISYIRFNELNFNSYGETRQLTTDSLLYWSNTQYRSPGGFAAGIGTFAGFSIILLKHFSIGSEFSSGV